jgi:hypothetical protein
MSIMALLRAVIAITFAAGAATSAGALTARPSCPGIVPTA